MHVVELAYNNTSQEQCAWRLYTLYRKAYLCTSSSGNASRTVMLQLTQMPSAASTLLDSHCFVCVSCPTVRGCTLSATSDDSARQARVWLSYHKGVFFQNLQKRNSHLLKPMMTCFQTQEPLAFHPAPAVAQDEASAPQVPPGSRPLTNPPLQSEILQEDARSGLPPFLPSTS
jgi:hypothetical protein